MPETREGVVLNAEFDVEAMRGQLFWLCFGLAISWVTCYFLLCREWLCQFDWARPLQHF